MTNRISLALGMMILAAAGCASSGRGGARITGEHSARVSDAWPEIDSDHRAATVPVHHTFTLRNQGAAPATIVSHRTRIDTVWSFADTNDGRLPRTINPGQTIEVAMSGTMRKPERSRFFTDLTLDSGQVVTLEIIAGG